MTDLMTPAQRRRCMSSIRSSNTLPELKLRRALWAAGMRFRVRLRIPGKPDVAFTRAKLAVFVDGCFWHGCPLHGTRPKTNTAYWNAKIERNMARDREVDQQLSALGWRVLRYWEHMLEDRVDSIVEDIGRLRPRLTSM